MDLKPWNFQGDLNYLVDPEQFSKAALARALLPY